jgi:hypothetical protein
MITICLIVVGLVGIHGLPEPKTGLGEHQLKTLIRVKRGGACTSTADCVAGNVCSKWGWCQWTSIYGADGPSQGSAAPGGGVAGQCVTSADCASRVPYCSKLGYCHGGRLPFDEAQLEIPDGDKQGNKQPQGFVNNNPRKNNSALKTSSGGGKSRAAAQTRNTGKPSRTGSKSGSAAKPNPGRKSAPRRAQASKPKPRGSSRGGGNANASGCPGGNLDSCIEACIPIKQVRAYGACVEQCGKRC